MTVFTFSVATPGALSYAELGTSIPQSGGEHAYLLYAFGKGKREKNIGRIVAFFFDWVKLFIVQFLSKVMNLNGEVFVSFLFKQ